MFNKSIQYGNIIIINPLLIIFQLLRSYKNLKQKYLESNKTFL